VRNAICIHEEDTGILWKHTDIFNNSAQSRRQRRLVVSYFTTVGNYDYGFYWYFSLDGTIECEVKMTGIVFTAAHPGGEQPYSTEVAPGLGAPVHQHLFSARLDMTVDGLANAVEEVDVSGLPIGPDNPFGNAIARQVTRLTSEGAAGRPGDASRGRVWRILSTSSVNRFGQPTAFTLCPEPAPALLADPSSPLAARAGFATRALWVTRYDPAQRYPAGDFVNQSPGGRAARLHVRRPGHRRAGHRAVAYVRADSCGAPGGLAGHAGHPDRVHAPADGILRPQPDAGRPRPGRALPSRARRVTPVGFCAIHLRR
jgi:primary-amine oxidase